MSRMYAHHINELAPDRRDGPRRWYQLVNVQFFLHGTPRLIPLCRLFGHQPRVTAAGGGRHPMWVACRRCGVRGAPQGALNPDLYQAGARYPGPWHTPVTDDAKHDDAFHRELKAARAAAGPDKPLYYSPGPIDPSPRGTLGGQLVIGKDWGGPGIELKVGNAGSEHTLAARISAGWLGTLYLHTEGHGQWLQRRLNPVGYESKVIRFGWTRGRVEWRWWAPRDAGWVKRAGDRRLRVADAAGRPLPWWRAGELRIVPPLADWLFGAREYQAVPARLDYDDSGGRVLRIVRLPEGDYAVRLKLEHVTWGRRRGRRHRYWSVDWTVAGRGLPTGGPVSGRDRGGSVKVRPEAVEAGTWAAEACADIAAEITRRRTARPWDPCGRIMLTDRSGKELQPA